MSRRTDRLVAVVAVVLLLLTTVAVWTVADVRADRESDAAVADAVAPVVDRQASADYDGDGIEDSADACPTRPETINGFKDSDGCPDIAATTRAS